MALDMGAAKWCGGWDGVAEALEQRDKCSVEELQNETGLPTEVDVSHAIGCEPLVTTREEYEDAGVTALAMEVVRINVPPEDSDTGEFYEGDVYLTNASLRPDDFQVHFEHQDRSMFGYHALNALKKHVDKFSDINVPTHATVGRGWVVEGIDGKTLENADESDNDAEWNLKVALAAHLLVGNKDAHGGNFIVDDESNVWGFDLDRAGYNLFGTPEPPEYPEFPAEENYDDMDEFQQDREEYDRQMMELQDEGWVNEYGERTQPTPEGGDAVSKAETAITHLRGMHAQRGLWRELKSLMGETLMRYDDEELDAILDEVPDQYSEYKENFRANLYAARDYDFPDLN